MRWDRSGVVEQEYVDASGVCDAVVMVTVVVMVLMALMVMVMSMPEVRSETAVSSRSTGRNAFRSAES
jgi:hypothetical protein